MNKLRLKTAPAVILFLVAFNGRLCGSPQPTDVFCEYQWTGPYVNARYWQRVTDPNARHPGAKEYLPNPVNSISIRTADATKIEAYIELLQCHAGTSNKRIRVNGNPWIQIPEAVNIAGDPECYQTMIYPAVQIPLSHFNNGSNTFELTSGGQTCLDFGWGQWLVYGVTFRVYYSDSEPHPTGSITSPTWGAVIGENPTISAAVTPARCPIRQVDFIGYYEDFNYEGDNIWRQWHYIYHCGQIRKHLGTDTTAPYSITWDTSWLPDQNQPVKIMARIVDASNMCYMTEAVENITFRRTGTSVKLYKCYDIPKPWKSRVGKRHCCHIDITDDLTNAIAARMYLCSWSGGHADEIGINDNKILDKIGFEHNLSYDEIDVPLRFLQVGQNTPYTYATTSHHGIEVNWPGTPLKIKYLVRPAGKSGGHSSFDKVK